MRLWRFPKHLAQPIALHHLSLGSIRQQAPNGVQPAATLALANRLTHALLLGDSGNETIYPTQELCRALRIGPEALRRIEEEVPAQLDDITLALLSRSDASPWTRTRELVRQRFAMPLRPLWVSPEPDLDAMRLVLDQVREPGGEAPPNLAVLHLADARAGARLQADLPGAERAAGASDLPLLVLSPPKPPGQPEPQPLALGRRRVAHLTTPVNLTELTETVNHLLVA